jgi:hypothetical protein
MSTAHSYHIIMQAHEYRLSNHEAGNIRRIVSSSPEGAQ